MRRSRIDRVKIITNGEISRPDHLIYPLELISVDKLSEVCQEEKATPETRPSRANVPNSKVSQERRQHLNSNLARWPSLEPSDTDGPDETRVTRSELISVGKLSEVF
ncbi:hypothetical protein AVEN_247826-1 [Araneus ventricosus]|uniref:DUF5641 domain-containing protein n=1 Tax=Araneus ventricosus TaxID=182803 RepID=A0A4Y2LRX2_ARAVE|nr:hypothetical protein AVEN_247826-1 [Araneus ventricosus]